MVLTKTKEKKLPVERLQEEYLSGPADESVQQVLEELKVDEVVVSTNMPRMEKIVFRNQRDPGHVHIFFYASGTHPYRTYKLIDGKEYTLPWEVIKNLEGCRENIEKYRKNSDGLPEIYIAGYKTHFVCERV